MFCPTTRYRRGGAGGVVPGGAEGADVALPTFTRTRVLRNDQEHGQEEGEDGVRARARAGASPLVPSRRESAFPPPECVEEGEECERVTAHYARRPYSAKGELCAGVVQPGMPD